MVEQRHIVNWKFNQTAILLRTNATTSSDLDFNVGYWYVK